MRIHDEARTLVPASTPEPVNAPIDHDAEPRIDFRTLYRRCFGLVWWVVQGSGVPEAWIEDVVQDAFLIIHRRLPELDPSTPVRSWVIGIARNAAYSHRRGAARRQVRQSAVPEPERPSAVDSVVAYRQAWDQVNCFLGQLDDEQREAFVLCDLEGVAPAEVAHALQISRNTVYSRRRLARSKLVDHFAERPRAQLPGLLRSARRQGQPTPQHKRRTWAALATKLPLGAIGSSAGTGAATGLGPATAAGAWLTAGKAALASVTVAALTLGAIGVVGRSMAPSRADEPSGAAQERTPPPTAASAPGDPLDADASRPRSSPVASTPSSTVASSTPPLATVTDPAARSASGSPQPSPSATLPGPRLDPGDAAPSLEGDAAPSLEGDVGLLRRASQQLERGRPAQALATLDHHARAYPESTLSGERLGLRVRALCASGSTTQAQALAARYVAEHPGTRLAATLANPCPPR